MVCPQCSAEFPEKDTHCPACGFARPVSGELLKESDGQNPTRFLSNLALAATSAPQSPKPSAEQIETSAQNLVLTLEQQHFIHKIHFRRVRVTYLLIAINLVVFLLLEWNGGSKNANVLIEFGARYTPLIREGQYWRLLTNIFLHAGYLHILFNMYGLFNLGSILERLYGPTRFLFLYLCSGVVGSVVSWIATQSLSVGASGAVFGVAGVMVVYGFKHKSTIPHEMASSFGKGALPFIALNLYLGFSHPQIDNYAHIGGLLAGVLLSALMNPADDPLAPAQGARHPYAWTNVAMQLASIAMLLYGTASAVRNYWPLKRLHLAEAFFTEGTYRLQAGKFDQAVAEFGKAIAVNPRDARFHLSLGAAYFKMGETEKAIAEYDESLRIKPDAAETHVNLAEAWKKLGEKDKAIGSFREAIRLKPDLLPAYFELGLLYLEDGRDEAAAELFQSLVKAKPTADSSLVIGQAYLNGGRIDPALDNFRQATQLKPNLAQAHLLLGTALLKKNLLREAAESCRRAMQIDPGFSAARSLLAHVLAQSSVEHLKKQEWDEAEVDVRELLTLDAKSPQAHLLLGTVFANKKQFAKAAEEFESFLKLAPDSPNAAKVRLEITRLRKMQG